MKDALKQDFIRRWRNVRCFAAIVRSPLPVRNAFEGHGLLAWWWKVVLALHGNPVAIKLSRQDRCASIADGFRFYGYLYRGLAIAFGAAAFLCWGGNIAGLFWIALLTASAGYLWVMAKLAFSGADEFRDSEGARIWQLVAFLFFVALFLSGALTVISMQVRFVAWLPDVLNGAITAGAMMLGVGSYFVELAALVTSEPRQPSSLATPRRTPVVRKFRTNG